MVESPTIPEYAKYLSSYALFIITISAYSTPFPQIHLCSPLHRLIRIATRGVMEILGLDPYQSETQYPKVFFETLRSGDKVDACLRLVSSLSPLFMENRVEVDTRWRRSGYMSPLSKYLSIINGWGSNARKTISAEWMPGCLSIIPDNQHGQLESDWNRYRDRNRESGVGFWRYD